MTLDGNWGFVWLTLAALIGLAELLVPGVFLVFLAAGAAATGVLTLLFPELGMVGQLLSLAGWTAAAVLIGKRWYGDWPVASADPLLNDRAARLIGQQVVVVEPLVHGSGRVRLADGEWPASGPDMPIGMRARIERVDGGILIVAPLPAIAATPSDTGQ